MSAPRCLAQVQDAHGIELWLEDVAGDGSAWTPHDWEHVAARLGNMAGPHACGARLPDHAWLSRRWLESWVEQAAGAFTEFEEAVGDPWLAPLYPPRVAAVVRDLWDARHLLYRKMRAARPVLGHLDAVPVNVVLHPGRVVLLDWAFAGHAALGEDLAPLVGPSSLFGGPPPGDLARVDETVFGAYIDGLRDAGWKGDAAGVRFVYCASAALRYCVGAALFFVSGIDPQGRVVDAGGLRNEAQRAFHESSLGRSIHEIIDVLAPTFEFLALQLGTEALRLLAEA